MEATRSARHLRVALRGLGSEWGRERGRIGEKGEEKWRRERRKSLVVCDRSHCRCDHLHICPLPLLAVELVPLPSMRSLPSAQLGGRAGSRHERGLRSQ